MKKIMKSDWTVCTMLTILMGSFAWTVFAQVKKSENGNLVKFQKKAKQVQKSKVESDLDRAQKRAVKLEAELKVVKEELSVIRKELANVLNESDLRDKEYARLQMSIAASLAEGTKKSYNKENTELLKALLEISEKGEKLVISSAEFCDYIDTLLEKKEITDVDKVRIKFRMDKLKSNAELFHAWIKSPPKSKLFRACRILAVNDELQIIVLGVGSTAGVRNGLLLRTGKEKEIKVKIIAVRPFISGAIVVKGNIGNLAPGMLVEVGK